MAPLEDQNVTLHFDFAGHLFIFRARIIQKSVLIKAKNNSQSTSKQLQNIQKGLKTVFMSLKIAKMNLSKSQNLTYNFVLDLIYRTFELKIQLKIGFLRSKIILKQLLNKSKSTFKKFKIMTFQATKMIKSRVTILANVSIFFFLDLGT